MRVEIANKHVVLLMVFSVMRKDEVGGGARQWRIFEGIDLGRHTIRVGLREITPAEDEHRRSVREECCSGTGEN